MVNLEHLHVINTICEQGSFQKASEKLHKVRSAVSYTVKQVEEYYSIEIFNRKTYRPELTAEGKILIVKIRQLLKQAGEFETFVNEMKGINETELRLGVSSIFPLDKITDLLSDLKIQFPSTTIHLNIEVASGERLLLDEQVDIAIFGSLNHHNSIDYRLIDTLDIPLLISDQFPIKDPDKVTEAELAAFPQVILKSTDRQSPDSGIVDDALKWYVTDQHTKKALICKGFGWGRLPYHLVEKEIQNKQLIRLSTQGELNLPMYITKLKNQPLGPVALKIWQYFL
ncbi:MAG: LysR family transcriptional regulator [Pseudomonadales bacterium]|nr:LysR family transcriptional regulator [Pseudomonadales bacterium]